MVSAIARHAYALILSAPHRASVRRVAMSAAPPSLSSHDKFMFDLNGFLVLRGVFTPEEVAGANEAIDAHAAAALQARGEQALRNTLDGSPHSAPGARMDMGGMLAWPKPHCDLFRQVLAHPRLVPYLVGLLGEGYRLDHQPQVVAQDRDSEGFALHGGPISGDDGQPQGIFNPELQYRCVHAQPWTSLLGLSVQLSDHNEGDGGFCIVRGSHKLNLPVPHDVAHGLAPGFEEHLYQPTTKAGDVVIWAEATVHGATPWRGAHQRRIALYRFGPANMCYGRGYLGIDPDKLEGLTPLQRAVLEPPYAMRLERPHVTPEAVSNDPNGPAPLRERSAAKKAFDRQLFGTDYL